MVTDSLAHSLTYINDAFCSLTRSALYILIKLYEVCRPKHITRKSFTLQKYINDGNIVLEQISRHILKHFTHL